MPCIEITWTPPANDGDNPICTVVFTGIAAKIKDALPSLPWMPLEGGEKVLRFEDFAPIRVLRSRFVDGGGARFGGRVAEGLEGGA